MTKDEAHRLLDAAWVEWVADCKGAHLSQMECIKIWGKGEADHPHVHFEYKHAGQGLSWARNMRRAEDLRKPAGNPGRRKGD